MGFTESRKKDGSKVVRPTGKGAGSTFINLGKDSAREGIEDLDIPEGVEPTFDDEDDEEHLSVEEVYARFKEEDEKTFSGTYYPGGAGFVSPGLDASNERIKQLEDSTVTNPGLNKAGKVLEGAGIGMAVATAGSAIGFTAIGYSAGATVAALFPPFLGIMAAGFGIMGGLMFLSKRLRTKAGATLKPEGKISDLWKKE